MENNKKLVIGMLMLFGIIIISLNLISAQEVSYCCEKLKTGAWCQNAPQSSCDTSFTNTPASCEATGFCKMGYCYDSQEGICSENTPKKVCDLEGGVWELDTGTAPPQCSLGCCVLEDQAAFVTLTRCKKLSSTYGLETDFRADITNEVQCIASATSEVKGACVYEEEFETKCKFISQKECQDLKGSAGILASNSSSSVNFHQGYLCSDESLGTNCGPSTKTTCVEGRDEVYFLDSCGNLANIYDASKEKDKIYWSKVLSKPESCGYSSPDGNANSATCGSCDYFLGSTCKQYNRGDDRVKPNIGDNICRDLSCEFEGKQYKHGETWCADAKGIDLALPGSRHFRMLCYNGEVQTEPCSDFRQEVCLQSEVNDFKVAACRPNKWQDCFSQTNKLSCENIDKRDCLWIEGIEIAMAQEGEADSQGSGTQTTQPFSNPNSPVTGNVIQEGTDDSDLRVTDPNAIEGGGSCLPKNQPGFNFWEEGDHSSLCALANTQCIVKYEKKALDKDWKCVENCECLEPSWELEHNNICVAIGDCGNSKNFIGVQGFNTGYKITTEKVK